MTFKQWYSGVLGDIVGVVIVILAVYVNNESWDHDTLRE